MKMSQSEQHYTAHNIDNFILELTDEPKINELIIPDILLVSGGRGATVSGPMLLKFYSADGNLAAQQRVVLVEFDRPGDLHGKEKFEKLLGRTMALLELPWIITIEREELRQVQAPDATPSENSLATTQLQLPGYKTPTRYF